MIDSLAQTGRGFSAIDNWWHANDQYISWGLVILVVLFVMFDFGRREK